MIAQTLTAARCRLLPVAGGGSQPLRAGPKLTPDAFSSVRQQAVLHGCKWDPQVADVNALAHFPLIMKKRAWNRIAEQAEQLAAETLVAEEEILSRPELLSDLGLPLALQKALKERKPLTPTAGRVMRFDFHYTTSGWRISEVNSDVPGGFAEASHFTATMAEHYPGLVPAGNPAEAWCDALAAAVVPPRVVALLSAPGYMEDHQVVAFLAEKLRQRECQPHLVNPGQILWRDGVAHLNAVWYRGPVNAIVRFYQAEWLARLPCRTGWAHYFRGGKTPVANPAPAIISESKRFPLLWGRLNSTLPVWRALLPETRDPRDVPWDREPGWLLKTAMCNTGDSITIPEHLPSRAWWQSQLRVKLMPRTWVAQRQFESVPISTPAGLQHVCVGVYTVNGRTAGAYARASVKPVIDFEAADVALLLEDDD